jgi:GGDEF domain-containing protein
MTAYWSISDAAVLQAFAADNELLVARYGGEEFSVLAGGNHGTTSSDIGRSAPARLLCT